MQQENDDLRRFIFQHFGVNLSAKPSSSKTSINKPIAPAPSVPIPVESAASTALSVMLNGTSGVQVLKCLRL